MGRTLVNNWNILTPSGTWQDGWRTGAPSTTTTMILFVSDLTGSDAPSATEGSKATPYRTLNKAVSRLRYGSPDWILLAKAETWTNQKFDAVFMAGLSATELMVFSSYNKALANNPPVPNPGSGGARPLIIQPANPNGWVEFGIGYLYGNAAVMGLEFYDRSRDPRVSPGWANFNTVGICPQGDSATNILIEDNKVSYYQNGITMDANAGNGGHQHLRRTIVHNCWGDKYGLGAIGLVPDFLVYQCLFDNNGWDPIGDPTGNGLVHNFYISALNTNGQPLQPGNQPPQNVTCDLTYQENISSNSKWGDQMRCGGNAYNNIQIGGQYTFNFGMPDPLPGGAAHKIDSNIYYEIGAFGTDIPSAGPDEHNGVWNLAPLLVINNIVIRGGPLSSAFNVGSGQDGKVTFTNNIYWKCSTTPVTTGSTIITSGFNVVDFTGANNQGSPEPFPFPNRTIGTYLDTILGGSGHTTQNYIDLCKLQSKDNWNPLLSVDSLNDYLRQGFGRPMLGSAYASGAAGIFLNALPNGTVGVAYTGSAVASGGTAPYSYAVTVGTLPNGLSFNASTGAMTGTPTVAGTFNFTIRATDSTSAFGTQSYTIVIAAASGIALSNLNPFGQVGTSYIGAATATGGTAPYVYTISAGSLPGGLSLNASTGDVTGTPTTAGTFNFSIRATDSLSAFNSRAYTINISAPVTITLGSLPNGTVGVAYSGSAAASGGTAPYTYALASGALPGGLSLNTSTGAVTGTPTAAGTFGFNIAVIDSATPGQNSGGRTYSVIIAPAAVIPTFRTVRLQVS